MLQQVDGINLFGLISIVSLLYCAPAAFIMERGMWQGAWQAASAKLGETAFLQLLAVGGLFYHLYNQVRAQGRRRASSLDTDHPHASLYPGTQVHCSCN